MRCTPARLVFASVCLAVGLLAPAARAADPPEGHARTDPGIRAEFRQLLQDVDLYLRATNVAAPAGPSENVKVSPAGKVRRAARRFAAGRLARIEAESPLSPEERAEWRELVRRHATRAAALEGPMPLPPSDAPSPLGPTPQARTPQPNGVGGLSGRVTRASDGAGIGGSNVSLYWDRWSLGYASLRTTVSTDASGNYSFTDLAPYGDYYVKTNNFDGYIDEAWSNVPCDYSCNPSSSGATPISVADGAVTSNIDLALGAGGRISGTVVNASTSAPISGLNLRFYNATNRTVTYASTNAAGVFTSYGGLVSGTYFVVTNTSAGSLAFVDELYDNIPCLLATSCTPNAGTPIPVTSASTTGGINFALDPGGGLSGKVADADTSAGLTGVRVQVFTLGGSWLLSTTTDGSGNWSTAQNLSTGSYLGATSNYLGYVDEMWDDMTCPGGFPSSCGGVSLATPISVTAGTVTSGIDFALEMGGQITGRVTDASTAAALAYTDVDIYTEDGRSLSYGYTDGSGSYTTMRGLPAGRYRAKTWSYDGYVNEIHDNKPCLGPYNCPLAEGSLIGVSLGGTTSGIDFALDKGGQIAGKVTDASTTAGVPEVYVDIYSPGGTNMAYGYTDAAGNYTTFVGGLPTGRYYAQTYQYQGAYVSQVYNNVPCAACRPDISGAPIDVTLGATTPNIDFALDKGGSISGRVTSAADGTAISGSVFVYTMSGRSVNTGSIGATGNYAVGGLPAGSYVARAANYAGFVNEVYNDRPCVASNCDLAVGTPISVTTGSTTPIDFALSPGARISGRVTDESTGLGIPGVTIYVDKPPSQGLAVLTTDGLGYFSTTAASTYGLPSGGYYVRTSNSQGYQDEVYDNIPCPFGCDVTAGTKVQLTAGATTANVNFALAKGAGGTGRITGKVTRSATGDPLPLFTVRIYDATGRLVSTLTTNFLGAYLSGSLPAGTYYVAAIVNSADYANELYSNVPFCSSCSPTTGTPVTVTADLTTSLIDIALDAGGRIEGRVTDASTSAPLLDASVSIYDTSNNLVRGASVDALGNYAVNGLVSGTYYALAGSGGTYVNKLYNDISCPACSPTTGTAIPVTAGNTASAIDFALARGGRVEGTVTRASDGNAVGASVTIYDSTGAIAAGSVQDGAGHYRSSSGLPSGTYYARAADSAGIYDAELYNNRSCNSCDPTTGDAITVTSPAATTAIDFSLGTRSLDFYTVSPCRVVDTRTPPSALGGPALAAREDRVLSVFARCGIPLAAKALSVNLTATGSTTAGNLRFHPGGSPVPATSALNYSAGQTRGNNAVVPVSRFGELAVYCGQNGGTVHFTLDVNGYFQ